ncbi:phage tail protein [Pseudomonas sp. SLFW]|uniref:phage tail protein n=1 Tax=Pseudomonas sp. SLFW TaxID=2683259 RepID=UPI0014130ABA|nr:phage tail protein [Pseudomonas sp. SLFW]NBB09532.1 phage tail protein [Pseudomonas sp. SLFW]
MSYLESMQSGLKHMVQAGEAGRKDLDGMLGPVNGAIGEITGAADELESLPFVGPLIGAKLKRITGAIGVAQSKVGQVVAAYGKATRAASEIQRRVEVLGEQAARAKSAVNKLAAKASPGSAPVFPSAMLTQDRTPAPEAVKPFPHLMIMQPLRAGTQPFFFNQDTAAFDELSRTSAFRWATQERLTRRPAQQAVGMGEDKLTIKGAIFPTFKGGLTQLNRLRSIGERLQPLMLTTGYGEVLGTWCLVNINEEQSALLQGGIPRKQSFTLEFTRYGDDMQNV